MPMANTQAAWRSCSCHYEQTHRVHDNNYHCGQTHRVHGQIIMYGQTHRARDQIIMDRHIAFMVMSL